VADAGDVRGTWFFAEPRDSALPAPALRVVETAPTGAGVRVTVTADALARDVTLLVDKVDPAAHAVDGLLTVLPGESVDILVTGVSSLPASALADPRVLRSANQLVMS